MSSSGAVFQFGAVSVKSSLAKLGIKPKSLILTSAVTNDLRGYWLADIYGGVYAVGDAHYYGSCRQEGSGCQALALPVIHIAPTPDGKGYWLLSMDGGVFSFGDARYFGAADQRDPRGPPGGDNVAPLGAPAMSMATTPTGSGYWLVGDNGTVVGFGAARSYGSVAASALGRQEIVAIAATPDGHGYWLTSTSGHVYAFGDAVNVGDCSRRGSGCEHLNSPVGSMMATPDGRGYWLFGTDGGVFAFGDAPFYGSVLSPKHVGPAPTG
ncbi:MAG TPA: hypothetical protein VME46_20650 [Acidimicrobiales bacterium]|nr:hypothetical protein [Acidimicrobiales bacterium]